MKMVSILSPIAQACDTISGERPRVRRAVLEAYVKRLYDMEDFALSFGGVRKCYAIQAGREIQVMVDAINVTDGEATALDFYISRQLEQQPQYPGQEKVIVIRETRAVNYAK
jgi:ribonucrease Y